MKGFTTKAICRAGIIAALYAAITFAFSFVAYGPIQFRPSEALTLLPLLFLDSVPGLFVGCILANLLSQYGVWDVLIGSLITLIAAFGTRLCRKLPARWARVTIGGLFPVLLNAFLLPLMWLLMATETVYWYNVGTMIASQLLSVYLLGVPLYYVFERLQRRGVALFADLPARKARNDANANDPDDDPPANPS